MMITELCATEPGANSPLDLRTHANVLPLNILHTCEVVRQPPPAEWVFEMRFGFRGSQAIVARKGRAIQRPKQKVEGETS